MSEYRKYHDFKINHDPIWGLLEKMYDNWGKSKGGIPKIIHQIWLGGEMPPKFRSLSDTWREKNPDWEYRLWGDADAKKLKMINRKLFDRATNYAITSDLLRYEILYKYGGVYADTDFECMRSFNDFTNLEFFVGSGYSTFPHVYNGLMGAKSGYDLIFRVINAAKKKENDNIDLGGDAILKFVSQEFFSKIFIEYVKENCDGIVALPRTFFYPLPPGRRYDVRALTERDRAEAHKYMTDKTYGIHYWSTSWKK